MRWPAGSGADAEDAAAERGETRCDHSSATRS
jgi:hypothetical protein